jgi:hypothetical protein
MAAMVYSTTRENITEHLQKNLLIRFHSSSCTISQGIQHYKKEKLSIKLRMSYPIQEWVLFSQRIIPKK